jgi:acetyltransferase-like isoleucine patch superfamily enzyme
MIDKVNYSNIEALEIQIGLNTVIEPTARIRGVNGPAKKITIGDNCYIGSDVQIICDEFELGDYSKIHHHCNIHGYRPCRIGHNLWMGQYSIIDSIGSVSIGNNCGIGAHSQLWSHIKYGDQLEGCKFNSEKPMEIGNDVWFVGHCIVSPIVAQDKSMALVGSVIVKDMMYNEIYSGVPARSISYRIGNQFDDVSTNQKYKVMNAHLVDFKKIYVHDVNSIEIVKESIDIRNKKDVTYFVASERKYTKRSTEEEIAFMKYLLPEKAKFIPCV